MQTKFINMKSYYKKIKGEFSITFLLAVLLSATAFGQYCEPVYSSGTGDGDYCSYVGLGDISNATDGATSPFYTYYDLSTDLQPGTEYTLEVTSGSYTSNNDLAAWIDYNADGDFYDEGELLGTVLDLIDFSTGYIVFTVPVSGTSTGTTRMRVREIYNMGIPPDPCGEYAYGETEDYNVNLLPGAENDIAVTAITSPVSGADMGYEDVTITVKNNGTADASGFTVNYNVDGGFTTGEFFPGTLAVGETVSHTFGEGWTFSEYDCYEVMAWIEYDIDEIPENDSYTKTVCNLGPITGTDAYLIYSNVYGGAEPWSSISNTNAMNSVFGADGWNLDFFETLDPSLIFNSSTCFVFLEGGDAMADELETFLGANSSLIESWVSFGGHLLLNSAPNEGDGMSFGFDETTLNYPYFTDIANSATEHPIFDGPFTPVGSEWTGGSFGHASVSGSDWTALIVDAIATDNIVLAEKMWGDGIVIFGGMTPNNFHSPLPEADNLRANIIAYLSCGGEICTPAPPMDIYADGISATTASIHWTIAPGTSASRLVLWELSTGEVRKYIIYDEDNFTVPGELSPSTTYGARLKSACLEGETWTPGDYSEWYYFTTDPLREGEFTKAVSLYPNPNDGNFRIQLNGYESGKAQVQIINVVGQVMYDATMSIDANASVHDVSLNLAAGTYIVKVINGSEIVTNTIIVE